MARTMSSRSAGARTGLLVCALLGAASARAADTLFVSGFGVGEITSIDIATGATTTIVVGLALPEDGACSPTTGRIYFAESNSGRLTGWNPDGSSPQNIIPAAGVVRGPEGLSFDVAGNLYFNTRLAAGGAQGAWMVAGADPANPAVQVVPPFTTFGEGSDIVVAGPHEGALLVVDRTQRRVLISEPPGNPATVFIDSPAFPATAALFGIATNGCGEVFVAVRDFGGPDGSGVYRFDAEGAFLDVFTSGLADVGFLDFDSDGNLFVSDESAGVVWRVRPDGARGFFAAVPSAIGLAMCRDRRVPACVFCDAGGPYQDECEGTTTCVDLDGSASISTAGLPLTYAWTSDCPAADFAGTEADVAPTLCLETTACEARCTATLTVSDGNNTRSCSAEVVVEDTTPPAATPDELGCLWPPNHWYVCLEACDLGIDVMDSCSPNATFRIDGCDSDQPDDAREDDPTTPWNGDGHTSDDCIVAADGGWICVRSERAGTGPTAQDGRHYGVYIVAEDECGNVSDPILGGTLHVPHDQSPHERPCLNPTKVGCRPNQEVPCRP